MSWSAPANRLLINGTETLISVFNEQGSVSEVARRRLENLNAETPRVVHVDKVGRRIVIGSIDGFVSETATLRPGKNREYTDVIVSRRDLRAPERRPGAPPLRVPTTMAVVSTFEWGKHQEMKQFHLVSRHRPDQSALLLSQRLREANWRLEASQVGALKGSDSGMLWANRGTDQIGIAVTPSGPVGSRVVIHWEKRSVPN